jgi:hypothetical protein
MSKDLILNKRNPKLEFDPFILQKVLIVLGGKET